MSNHPDFNSPVRRTRRKTWRELTAAYDALLRAAGFTPAERRAILAIEMCLYEIDGHAPETPRPIALTLIGAALTSKSDEPKARTERAREACGHIFNHAIPRTGYQVVTRYKAEDESGRPHEFASQGAIVAEVVAELWNEEKGKILAVKGAKGKAATIAEALERIASEALSLLPRCEVELIDPNGESYAYVSAPEAKTYCKSHEEFTARPYTYTPPEEKKKQPRPFYSEDLEKMLERDFAETEKQFDQIMTRNSYDQAREYATRWLQRAQKFVGSWIKVSGAEWTRQEEEEEELILRGKTQGVPPADAAENPPDTEPDTPQEHGGGPFDNLAESNDLQTPFFESAENEPAENPSGSINFDTSLEAALFYVKDGWAIVPCCQFDPATDRCTGPESHHKDGICKGKTPLVKGKKPTPGAGYTAASRDKGLIRDWFTRQFPSAGVALRLDGHILIDCDVKDGAPGIESYEILADTFNLPSTLSAITPSGGRHYIFRLPEGLPVDFLGSWTRALDSAELGGIDLKVNNKGLAHVEPTQGKTGVYRWLDPTAEIATLPRECCDYLHGIHEREQQAKLEKVVKTSNGATAQPFDPDDDQAKYFKDAPAGERRPRLRSIACALAARGADAKQIVIALRKHDEHFTQPTNDVDFMLRVAAGAVTKFGQEVTQ